MMLTDAYTLLGQVNGATGSAVGIAVDPTGSSFFYWSFRYTYLLTLSLH